MEIRIDKMLHVGTVEEASLLIKGFLGQYKSGRVMFTLTTGIDGQRDGQFRCWDGPFGAVEPNHVDSGGKNLLFECYGKEQEMSRLVADMEELQGMAKWQILVWDSTYGGYHPVTLWLGFSRYSHIPGDRW